jgi:hypothetical protein
LASFLCMLWLHFPGLSSLPIGMAKLRSASSGVDRISNPTVNEGLMISLCHNGSRESLDGSQDLLKSHMLYGTQAEETFPRLFCQKVVGSFRIFPVYLSQMTPGPLLRKTLLEMPNLETVTLGLGLSFSLLQPLISESNLPPFPKRYHIEINRPIKSFPFCK